MMGYSFQGLSWPIRVVEVALVKFQSWNVNLRSSKVNGLFPQTFFPKNLNKFKNRQESIESNESIR